jgi:peptide/nickel transport system permease protein
MWKIKFKLFLKNLKRNFTLLREGRIGIIGLAIIIFFAFFALAYPLWANRDIDVYDPILGFDETIALHPSPPAVRHPLGTDLQGRDILSQLMYGARMAFTVGFIAALFSVSIATVIGAAAAYRGGATDTFFMRLANILMLFPFLAFIPVLNSIMELTLLRYSVIIGLLSGFGGSTLIMKSRALGVVHKPFIESAKVCGGSSVHIIKRHVIPNIISLSFLYMMFTVQGAIFSEAILSWLGFLNIRMSWGIMLHTSSRAGYLVGPQLTRYWWMWVPAGFSISFICAAFYLLGRGLDPVINPRLRKR